MNLIRRILRLIAPAPQAIDTQQTTKPADTIGWGDVKNMVILCDEAQSQMRRPRPRWTYERPSWN